MGGVGFFFGLLDPFNSKTEKYLKEAGLELAKHNVKTFLTMISGGSVLNVCPIGQSDSERILNQDRLLVEYEQNKLEAITNNYFNGKEDDRNFVMKDINDVFNHKGVASAPLPVWLFSDGTINDIINEHFHDKGIEFDINDIEHRKILGKAMVEKNAGK